MMSPFGVFGSSLPSSTKIITENVRVEPPLTKRSGPAHAPQTQWEQQQTRIYTYNKITTLEQTLAVWGGAKIYSTS